MNPGQAREAATAAEGFTASRALFDAVLGFLDGPDAAGLSHGELEARLDTDGRELLCRLLGDHLTLRAQRETRVEVIDAAGVTRTRVEAGHTRALSTVFGGDGRTPGLPGTADGQPPPRRPVSARWAKFAALFWPA